MTPNEFKVLGADLWGGRGWQSRLAEELEVSSQTVSNWATGRTRLPRMLHLYIRLKWIWDNKEDNHY